ncbi:Protein of unknown function [Gryllus bimaculatus]|nr:Protein of unknown function [Gryllus bimaculatus]
MVVYWEYKNHGNSDEVQVLCHTPVPRSSGLPVGIEIAQIKRLKLAMRKMDGKGAKVFKAKEALEEANTTVEQIFLLVFTFVQSPFHNKPYAISRNEKFSRYCSNHSMDKVLQYQIPSPLSLNLLVPTHVGEHFHLQQEDLAGCGEQGGRYTVLHLPLLNERNTGAVFASAFSAPKDWLI